MCFGGGNNSQPAPVTPAAAPAPAAPGPTETVIGSARKAENVEAYGTIRGPDTRIDRAATGGVQGGSGLNL